MRWRRSTRIISRISTSFPAAPIATRPRLIDSNLDWGQDLVNLRRWLRDNRERGPVGIAYFGQIPPNLFAARRDPVDWFLPPIRRDLYRPMFGPQFSERLKGPAPRLTPGLYAVSASFVRGLPFRVDDPSPDAAPASWQADEDAFGYFRLLKPFDRVGHSILLYRVTAEDASRVERSPLSPSRPITAPSP